MSQGFLSQLDGTSFRFAIGPETVLSHETNAIQNEERGRFACFASEPIRLTLMGEIPLAIAWNI
jgi:hypothetical protein